MRVLVAGATGVVGRQLLPLLQERGDEVVAVARNPRPLPPGVDFVAANVMDATAIAAVVARSRPDAIVNLLTAIPQSMNPRRFGVEMEPTNALRRRGTANLLAAAGEAYVVSESVAFLYDPAYGPLATEDRELWVRGPRPARAAIAAVQACEQSTLTANGAVLRFGHLYGPGTHLAADGWATAQIRSGKLPLVGSAASTFSFTHVHDAATGIVAALRSQAHGVFNIVDNQPATMATWLPEVARLLGARAPRKAPALMARMFAGGWGHAYMTSLVGASNSKAREELGWEPSRPSWRTGMLEELSAGSSATKAIREGDA